MELNSGESQTFNSVRFGEDGQFNKCSFSGNANFERIVAKSKLLFGVASFEKVPLFTNAILEEIPEINFDQIKEPEISRELRDGWHNLKKMAHKNHNNLDELKYHRQECRSRMRQERNWCSCTTLVGWVYELSSKFGLSFTRPFVWLCGFWFAFAVLYSWLASPYDPGPMHLNSLFISLHHASGILSPLDKDYQSFVKGLFELQEGGKYNLFLGATLLQRMISSILLFLIFLGLRNQFRIR